MVIKISTLNLCLGLPNKKTLVKQLLISEKIDILCLQETELITNLDHSLMSFNDYTFESETNNVKSRTGMYIRTGTKYLRRLDLEGVNSHMVVIDVKSNPGLRLITLYRSFNPQNQLHPRDFFKYQLELLKQATHDNTIILGDFNLDWTKKGVHGYQFRNYFLDMDNILGESNLVQLVNFNTWCRLVNSQVRESLIDHVYSSNPATILSVDGIKPVFGDHTMVNVLVKLNRPVPTTYQRRDWKRYSKESLCALLSVVDWNIQDDSVQSYWNTFENRLVEVVDNIAPMCTFTQGSHVKVNIPPRIKQKINQRKRLLRSFRRSKDENTKVRLDLVDKDVKQFFNRQRANNVRKLIVPGNTKSLWKAVNMAKDTCKNNLPKTLYENGVEIDQDKVADVFGSFFDRKIRTILAEVRINDLVHNGRRMVDAEDRMFMRESDVLECIKTLKGKNSEGLDRIPQRILVDGAEVLLKPISGLFKRIYVTGMVPDQWLIAKTIPVFKNKGQTSDISNYRPIANLCSTSKIFEKLILKRILEIQDNAGLDFTNKNQHGFKRKNSTSTLMAVLQSQIARALEDEDYVIVASLDLSSAFDLVDIDLLMKRLDLIGLPADVLRLIRAWLVNRSFYVSIDGTNSTLFDLLLGTVQGSILGPVLYGIFVSPLFDKETFLSYADDTFIPKCNNSLENLILDVEKTLKAITKWLRDSGLKVNQGKTEICLFSKRDTAPVRIKIDGSTIMSKKSIKVLGVVFDSKLNWSDHVAYAINRASRALNAIKLIRKFFNTRELISLTTSNYYSILYYNSEIWHLPSLTNELKHSLFIASAVALRVCLHYPDNSISYKELHKITKRATPEMICEYKMALLLYKTFNDRQPEGEWLNLNDNFICTSRQSLFKVKRAHHSKTGLNCATNRFHYLNDKIPLEWLNKGFANYKIECKKLFLSF